MPETKITRSFHRQDKFRFLTVTSYREAKHTWHYLAMATILNFLSAIFFLSLIGPGNGQCYPLTDLKVFQSQTGEEVQNKPQWKVTVLNDCMCSQLNIKLACNGFQTVEKIDHSMLAIAGETCRINNKQPLYAYHTFNFTYAWDVVYSFHPIYSEIACS